MSRPKPIRSVLEHAMKGLEIDFQLKVYSIWSAWKDILGETLAGQTAPRSVRNRILFVDVSHSAWIQQLQFLKPKLLQELNGFLGEPLIQDIRFRLGNIPKPTADPSIQSLQQEEKLDKETLHQIDSLLQKIKDGEVQKTLRDLLIKGARLERQRAKDR